MKFKKGLLGTVALLATAILVGCGNNSDTTQGKDKKEESGIVTKLEGTTEITFWHAMAGPQEEVLKAVTEDFMKENTNVKVTLQNQSSYPDLQAKLNSTMPSPDNLPTITQAYPGWLYSAATEGNLVDLKPYITNETIGWKDQEEIRKSLIEGAQIEGTQYGIPFNKSTEVLFYNEDLLKEYGVEVPKTKEELKEFSKTIYEKSEGKVVGAGFDSLSNYYVISMKDEGIEFNKDTKLDSKESKEIISYYGEGIDKGYFRVAGSDKYLSGPFANQQVAMYIGSSAGEAYTAKDTKGKFTYGVAAPPTENNIQQGTDIYMFNSASNEQKTAAFMFMKYLASPEAQLKWALGTGYIPIVDSVVSDSAYLDSDMKVPKTVTEATKNLFYLPVQANSDAASNELRTILENIYANPFKDEEKIIKDSASSMEQAWNQ